MTVRFGMNSSSDAESSGRANAKPESSSSEAGLSWTMRLIAQAEARRLAPIVGGRHKRHQHTASGPNPRVHGSRLCSQA